MDKGMTALKVISKFSPDFCFCIGDDTTDEDMFKALEKEAYTVKVGSGTTAAKYNLQTQVEVLPFLESLTSSNKVEQNSSIRCNVGSPVIFK